MLISVNTKQIKSKCGFCHVLLFNSVRRKTRLDASCTIVVNIQVYSHVSSEDVLCVVKTIKEQTPQFPE